MESAETWAGLNRASAKIGSRVIHSVVSCYPLFEQLGTEACLSKVPRTFRARIAKIKTAIACFGKLIFQPIFNVKKKTKNIAKFDGIEPRLCEGIKEIVTPEIGPKSFGTSEKQACVT